MITEPLSVHRAPELVAYRLPHMHPMEIRPSERRRDWMNATAGGFAYHCLPLVMANEFGWDILNPIGLRCRWRGQSHAASLGVLYDRTPTPTYADTAFGHGILTFHIPFLFRTPLGVALAVRGPANAPRDGIAPLEGVVETSWSTAKFTMNWKFTRADHTVRFEAGDVLCTIRPVSLGLAETLVPSVRCIESDPELAREYDSWSTSRNRLNAELRHPGRPVTVPPRYERDYMRGRTRTGRSARDRHRVRVALSAFAEGSYR